MVMMKTKQGQIIEALVHHRTTSPPPGPAVLPAAMAAATWQHLHPPPLVSCFPGAAFLNLQQGKPGGAEELTPPGMASTNGGQEPIGKEPPLPSLEWTLGRSREMEPQVPTAVTSSYSILPSPLCDHFLK